MTDIFTPLITSKRLFNDWLSHSQLQQNLMNIFMIGQSNGCLIIWYLLTTEYLLTIKYMQPFNTVYG